MAVNQQNILYLFVGPTPTGAYSDVTQVGWVPPGTFEADSPAFVKVIGQPFQAAQVSADVTSTMGNLEYPFGTTNYDNDFWDYGPWPHAYYGAWNWSHWKDGAGVGYPSGPFTDES
ncbi:hypothetical protein HYY75_02450, partial [bacterium]|nr:hypothetical protein [bacterium]